jgi:hypothetical protein
MARTKKKHCKSCDRDLAVTAFGKDRTTKDGLYRICLECDRAQQRAWRERKKAEALASK